MDIESLTVVSHSLSQTRELGALLGQVLEGDATICLEGELGAGKTSLVQGMGQAYGVREPITSPTFTLVNEYMGKDEILYHVDLYRLDTVEEMAAAGFEGYFYSDGICVIEWAEKARDILPPECLHITLKHVSEEERSIRFQAKGKVYGQVLRRLKSMLGSWQ